MNIFNQYLDKIKKILLNLSKDGILVLPDKLDGITAETPPSKFDSDISTNVAMFLSKINKKPPLDIAKVLADEIRKNDTLIEDISIVKPGFINIKFKSVFWTNFTKEILKNSKNFGVNNKEKKKKYLIEFVSANPTGPLHIGHIAGAYLPADIYVRYRNSKKDDVLFVCGSDEHGAAITLRAKKDGLSPKDIVDTYHFLNEKSFADIGINFDIYHRTSDPLHHQTAQQFFKTLDQNGIFKSDFYPIYWNDSRCI